MEAIGRILQKATVSATPTSETKVIHLPGSEPEKVWSCDGCGEEYPVSVWERWWEENQRRIGICLRCRRKEEAEAIRQIRGTANQILVRAGFSEVLAGKTLQDVRTKDEFSPERRAEVKEIAFSIFSKQSAKQGVCFIGPVGTGKTMWATLLARRYVRRGWKSVAMCRAPRFLDKARDQFSRDFGDKESIEEMLEDYLGKQFLVIDDLGVRRSEATGFEQTLFYRLVDERHFIGHRVYTVITTNRPLEDIDRDIGPQVRSRIMEMCHVIKLCGPDWRA